MEVPKRGDIIQLNFDPQSGLEQQKRRPALVISDTRSWTSNRVSHNIDGSKARIPHSSTLGVIDSWNRYDGTSEKSRCRVAKMEIYRDSSDSFCPPYPRDYCSIHLGGRRIHLSC